MSVLGIRAESRAAAVIEPAVRTASITHPRRISPIEIRRRIAHMLPGFLPVILWTLPHDRLIMTRVWWIRVIATLVGGFIVYGLYEKIRRSSQDRGQLSACLGYAGSILAMLLMFPRQPELATTVLAVLAFGDGSAALGGIVLGGRRLPWNRSKTIAGAVSFLLGGTLMATAMYWGEMHFYHGADTVTLKAALAIGALTTMAAAFVESIRSSVNDNIRVGVTASVMVIALTTCLR